MAIRSGRTASIGGKKEARPFVFPSLKVDGELWTQEVVIENHGQELLQAQQEAAKVIRQRRAALKAKEVSPVIEEDIVVKEPAAVEPQPVAIDVGVTVREWLALHLPSGESLMAAAASMASLNNIENRVRDLVESFRAALDGYRSDFTNWRDSVASEWAGIVSSAGELLAAWGAKVDEVDAFKAALEKDLRAYVGTLRGPKGDVGNTGMAGAAVTVVDRLPKGKGPDFMQPFLKRSAVVGDIAIDATTDMRYGWRWDGQSWERGPAMTSLQVRDVRVNSVQGAPQYTTQVIQQTGGGGGAGGLERFLVSSIGQGTAVDIASNANWSSAGYDSTAGELWIEVLDPTTGQSGVCAAVFDCGISAGDTRITQFALTGTLFEGLGAPDVDVDALRGGVPPIPPGITGITNIGTGHTRIRLQVGANIGGSKTYGLRGGVIWLQAAQGRAIPTDQVVPRPNWLWG